MTAKKGQFQKGREKTGGRKKGTKNKATTAIKDRIKEYIDNNFDSIVDDIENLEPQERIKTFLKLLEFIQPKAKDSEQEENVKHYILQGIAPITWVDDKKDERYKPITSESQMIDNNDKTSL